MSFITKRERVFNEYELYDLPPRNEGKLKAYASCTDARAWSHFCSDKAEHLVEIIKRNNETCRPKYVPTSVIVDTLMVAKNAEIARLRRRIEEFEQMLAVYDQLDLTCDQKCEIANAHAAIRAANKELDELCLDLDLSGFTEAMESDVFETGKSRGDEPNSRRRADEIMRSKGSESVKSHGDEWSFENEGPLKENKSNQAGTSCTCDASVSVHDPRIHEMQEAIISKDAKLNAMQNTIAVLENDVCEPYCIYAHIYTALEKIFGVLCQNAKYKLYLSLMTAGKDTRCIDIKGKILYKLKVLEKFSLALIAPCSQQDTSSAQDCACLRAEVIARLDTIPPIPDTINSCIDNKRAQLVADIMENDEMKEILSKDSTCTENDEKEIIDDCVDSYSIESENLKRLKNLQENYDELMACHEKLKYEKDCLQMQCHKYGDLEKELENLRTQLHEYNMLWNEKEHYRRRSLDLDSLKEQYMVLADESSALETQLKAESEINSIKSHTIEDLRNENIALEKKLNEALIAFEKDKNALQCKLKETECTVMCQEQQIKSLSVQIDRLLEQGQDKMDSPENSSSSLVLLDEIQSLKDEVKHLKDALYCSEDEKQHLQDEFEDKLKIINELKMDIEDWKSTYEKTMHRNDCLEKYTNNFQNEMHRLLEENKALSQDGVEKSSAIENLINVVNSKSHKVEQLNDEIEKKENDKNRLYKQLQELQELYNNNITSIENEKSKALESLHLAMKESHELLERVSDYNTMAVKNDDISKSLNNTAKEYEEIKDMLVDSMQRNTSLQRRLFSSGSNNSNLLQEIEKLREINSFALDSLSNLQQERNEYKSSLELTKKESEIMESKLLQFEYLSQQMEVIKRAHDNLLVEKEKLEDELRLKKQELEKAVRSIELCKKESENLIKKVENFKNIEEELMQLNEAHQKLTDEKHVLQIELTYKRKDLETLFQSVNKQNENLSKSSQKVISLQHELDELKKSYNELIAEKNLLQADFDNKTVEINNLYNTLESKIEENKHLIETLKSLEMDQYSVQKNITSLQEKNLQSESKISEMKRESAILIDKLQNYEKMENEFKKLKIDNDRIQNELNRINTAFIAIEKENKDLTCANQHLLAANEDLELALINERKQMLVQHEEEKIPYEDICKELENLRNEKQRSYNKIKELLDKLDESDNIISNMSENILARDDKIAMLDNHINHLEDEIRKLQDNLSKAITTGEEIKENSFEKYDKSMKMMEAHHSRAAHNIKLELAKLKGENAELEKQLSDTILKTEESSKHKNKYLSQVLQLQDEREIIISNIKRLELKSVGDSTLIPEECKLDDILSSLNRINKSLDARTYKTTSLEQTILKVQTSSQLLLSKADEAKKLVEKEKQKIISEKEEAIKDRLIMEKKLEELSEKLQNQITHDEEIIRDLEAQILNQKLINDSTQNYISKLKEELQGLRFSNQNSDAEINNLQECLQKLKDENKKYSEINNELKNDLKEKSGNMESLLKQIEELNYKPLVTDVGIQIKLSTTRRNISVQVEEPEIQNFSLFPQEINGQHKIDKDKQSRPNNHTYGIHSNILPDSYLNEVQILTASVEPSFDFVRNSYLNYKMLRLGPGRLEQYSISDEEVNSHNLILNSQSESKNLNQHNRSVHSLSFKNVVPEANQKEMLKNEMKSPSRSNESIKFEMNSDNEIERDSNYFKLLELSSNEPDKDIMVIFKENEQSYVDYIDELSSTLTSYEQVQLLANTVTSSKQSKSQVESTEKDQSPYPLQNENNIDETTLVDKNMKLKLNINLPRADANYHPVLSTDESINHYSQQKNIASKKKSFTDIIDIQKNNAKLISQENSTLTISNDNTRYSSSYISIKIRSEEDAEDSLLYLNNNGKKDSDLEIKLSDFTVPPKDNIRNNQLVSHHTLSRVGADAFLIKPDKNIVKKKPNETNNTTHKNFALNYILDTVQHEGTINDQNILTVLKEASKNKSDEQLSPVKILETTDDCTEKYSSLRLSSSLEFKTTNNGPSNEKAQKRQPAKLAVDRGTLAKMDVLNSYEAKIHQLTRSLEITEKEYKQKLEAIKSQYDSNIKYIINEHNQGVKNIQGLHEETLKDILKIHENEVENLRTMSIEANRRAEKLEKENQNLKIKLQDYYITALNEEPTKIDCKKRRKNRLDPAKILTKTNVEAFNVKPKIRSHGPCTCSLDINVTDTIRNIFEQVDEDQRKTAELTYMKYIANKILNVNVESLDAQELSFLHLKVCRIWKLKLSKEEALQKRIDSLETELFNRQKHAQEHIAELDRKVEEEKRRLQEVREAVCKRTPSPTVLMANITGVEEEHVGALAPERDVGCGCSSETYNPDISERRSVGDLIVPGKSTAGLRPKKHRTESNRAVSAKIDVEEKRERRLYNEETPTRLRRSHDRPLIRRNK